ncbi:MAG: hypothetical protein KAJ64_05290, partial [Thermoplasmata archaeon]|nr:hypothetical protein [Thermoplasmata archaeon]
MKINKLMSIAIVAIMLSVSFAVGISVSVQAGTSFLEDTAVPWTPSFTPNDIAWNDAGTTAVVVGLELTQPGPNAYTYHAVNDTWFPLIVPDQAVNLTGVAYDGYQSNMFWLCGIYTDMSGVYYWVPASGNNYAIFDAPYSDNAYDIAVDQWGNPLVVGWWMTDMYYLDAFNGAGTWTNIKDIGGSGLSQSLMRSVCYNENEHIFYAVGDWQGARNALGANGIMFYTDAAIAPLTTAEYCYRDFSGFPETTGYLASIEWNQLYNYGLAVGSGIYKIYPGGNGTIIDDSLYLGMPRLYSDISWDTDGYEEAAIVGGIWNAASYEGSYIRYIPDNNYVSDPYFLSAISPWCVGFKPPASPKLPFIPLAGGGIVVNVQATDPFTTIT